MSTTPLDSEAWLALDVLVPHPFYSIVQPHLTEMGSWLLRSLRPTDFIGDTTLLILDKRDPASAEVVVRYKLNAFSSLLVPRYALARMSTETLISIPVPQAEACWKMAQQHAAAATLLVADGLIVPVVVYRQETEVN